MRQRPNVFQAVFLVFLTVVLVLLFLLLLTQDRSSGVVASVRHHPVPIYECVSLGTLTPMEVLDGPFCDQESDDSYFVTLRDGRTFVVASYTDWHLLEAGQHISFTYQGWQLEVANLVIWYPLIYNITILEP